MKQQLYFDFRDVFRIPRIALSGKKIWTHFLANFVGYFFFIIFSYIGIAASGVSLGGAIARYHFFPFPYDISLTGWGWTFYSLGSLIWVIAICFASLAVSRITYKEFKGDFFFSSGDGWKYVKKHWHPLIFAPLAVVGIVIFFLIMAMIAALLGKIPYVGEFIFSLPFLLYFPVAIFVLYSVVVLFIVLTYTPAIVGTSEEDTLESVFQSYSLLWSQPWRLVTYETIWGFLSMVASYLFGIIMAAGVAFITVVFGMSWLMGDKIFRMMEISLFYLGGDSVIYHQFIQLFTSPFATFGYLYNGIMHVDITEGIASAFLALGLFVIMNIVVSYSNALSSVGQTIVYLILRKKKDDENLLERKDEDELAEEEEEDLEEDFSDEEFSAEIDSDEEIDTDEEHHSSEENGDDGDNPSAG